MATRQLAVRDGETVTVGDERILVRVAGGGSDMLIVSDEPYIEIHDDEEQGG